MTRATQPRPWIAARDFRLVFAIFLQLFWAVIFGMPRPTRAQDDSARRAQAKDQFARAESLRAALEAKPDRERSAKDYEQVVSAYRRVYLITPRAAEDVAALKQVGDTYSFMGGQFDRMYFSSAVEAYEFLQHEYPMNRFREETALAIASIRRNHLGQSNLARQAYEDFLKEHPQSKNAAEATRALAEMDAEDRLSTDAHLPGVTPQATPPAAGGILDKASSIGPVRVWNADTYTRIVIDLGAQAKYQAARIFNPDRIYFDIENAKLSRDLARNPIAVPGGGYLKGVRVAQNKPDVVRVVLEVAEVKDYSVFELADPDRLVVDVYGPNADAQVSRAQSPAALSAADFSPAARSAGPAVAVAAAAAKAPDHNPTLPPALQVKESAAALGPSPVPEPTHDGQRSLTRALGLKTSHIVIDAGHGGHDTGTIGPGGLMEKDLSLDVARRLGKLIDERLPTADVTFTRDDDSTVPLEKRTAMANEAKADLFLSIHANSSDDRSVSGVETYYLNFDASADAMEVATRENALAQHSVHDLSDLVKKIADNDKAEESRDFATDVENALSKHMVGPAKRNRGVRKAPFIVLIGADMPSVLTEISFLSNPDDEQWLKKPESRQQIAEGLFEGIQNYLHSTNSISPNVAATQPAARLRLTSVAPGPDSQ
jgi:N-acetylmuramoyl-L-alanine amidase